MSIKMGSIYLYLVVIYMGLYVDALSTHDKTDHFKYHPKFYELSAHPFKVCKDTLNKTTCAKYEPHCENDKKLQKVCKRTCGLCPAVSPMSCKASKYGCCWDNITKADGANGEGCPACQDRSSKCTRVSELCYLGTVRRTCPITCQVPGCATVCHDDISQADYCPFFKQSGFCEIDGALLKQFCAKTCGFCDNTVVTEIHPILVKHGGQGNPPREAVKKAIIKNIEEEEKEPKKKESAAIIDETKLEELLKEESMMQKKDLLPIKKKSAVKSFDDEYLRMLETLSKREITKDMKTDDELPIKKKEIEKEKDAADTLEKISLVKDELEKKTEDLLNDLIEDSLAQKSARSTDETTTSENVEKKETGEIAELEAKLLDMLLQERSKKSVV